jgi:hypothetical protein
MAANDERSKTYVIEQRLDGILNAWNLVAVHGDGTTRVVLHFLTEPQARLALHVINTYDGRTGPQDRDSTP